MLAIPQDPIDYPIWEVIQNGNGPVSITIDSQGQIKVLPPRTAEEILARERERKARTNLLMALPEDHLAKFNKMTDAKEMWEAIKSRFGGNDESKKMQKYILKQQFEGFSVSNSEGLHKGYDRFQSLLSQLEIHGAGVSTEDANQKFLRSLPSAWSQVSLIMRTKPGVDSLSFDDLYNNLRVFENDVKVQLYHPSSTQNCAFYLLRNTISTNDVSTAYGVSNPSGHNSQYEQTSSYSLLANQSSCPQLDHEDWELLVMNLNLEEEMDLIWQVAMISMRMKSLQQSQDRHFARGVLEPREIKIIALVTIDGDGADWDQSLREEVDYALWLATAQARHRDCSVETRESLPEPAVNEPKVVNQPKVWSDAPIIEEYETDSEDEHVSVPIEEQETPSFANKQVKTPRETVKNQFTHSKNPRVDKKGLGYRFVTKACFVCGSLSHLIRDCDFHEKRMAKQAELTNGLNRNSRQREIRQIWNNVQRVNKQNQFVPSAVLTRTGKIPVNIVRTGGTKNISTARHNFNRQAVLTSIAMKVNTLKPIVNRVRPANIFHKPHLPFSRPLNNTTALRTNFSKQKVNIAKVNAVSAVGGKNETAVKPSAGCNWRPQRHNWHNDYPHRALQNKGIVDSRCSRHMTGNKAYLAEYQDFNGGLIAFGGSKGYITGKGKIKTGKLDFEDVCFVKELQHFNLFSVSQMCDKKNKVLFTDSECLVLSPEFKLPDENQVLLRIPRQNDMYNFNLENIVPSGGLACLIAKATIDESNKWHRRLGHVNFKNLNKLVKGNLVRGLPSKIFQNDHTCVACQKGKQHKASCKAKSVNSVSHSLQLLHMYLFGPTSVRSLNHKTYCLVIIDDFNRSKGIKREYSNARTPQQNGVAERKNRTLIEAARTMLADSFLPKTFWAEAVSTACYVLNRLGILYKARLLSTDDHTEGGWATQTTQTPTSTIFGDDETIAQVLLNMSQAKAVSREKEKGIEFKDIEETERSRPTSTRSLLTLKPLPKIDPKDKEKKKIEEEDESRSESDGIPEAEKKFKQLASDEEMARKVQEEWEGEEERKRLAKEEATNDALIRNYDDIKARIKADRLLAKKLQEEEREQFTIEERAKFLHDTIAAQRKFLAQQRSEAIRNRPPTKNQLRNQMMTYLKHVGNFKHSDLKTKKFEEIQALYEKIKRSDEDFISIGSAEDERLIKKMNEKGIDSSKNEMVKEEDKEEESTRKRKLGTRKKMKSRKRRFRQNTSEDDSEKENDELRLCLTIAPDEEKEVDYEILDRKYPIKEWKIEYLGTKPQVDKAKHLEEINQNVVIRSNGQKRYFSTLMRVLSIFDRDDLNAIYQLVMDKYQDEIPEGFDRVLWGDLMIMFNPDDEDKFWNSQQD
ncbi:putative ribonuclease H-like domain-containing protein [Tanacetum coccineum]